MGRGKSKFLEVLGGEWYGSLTRAIGDPDFLQEIQGLWLVEIPDMTGFGRREHSVILATITIRVDRYRPSYGRRAENRPRACVLVATSETDDYLSDTRGRRRFWPLRCNHIDLDVLASQRPQIFAEAVARYKAGASWHEMPEETDRKGPGPCAHTSATTLRRRSEGHCNPVAHIEIRPRY
jgi:putative DNA primase/helicase